MHEPCDDFAGEWQIFQVAGKEVDACVPSGEYSPRVVFWEDGTGTLQFGSAEGVLECDYGESLDGSPAVDFKWKGRDGGKPARGSGIGAIEPNGKIFVGSVKIGRRTSGIVARRVSV